MAGAPDTQNPVNALINVEVYLVRDRAARPPDAPCQDKTSRLRWSKAAGIRMRVTFCVQPFRSRQVRQPCSMACRRMSSRRMFPARDLLEGGKSLFPAGSPLEIGTGWEDQLVGQRRQGQ